MAAPADVVERIRLYPENSQKDSNQRANESSVPINYEEHSQHLDKVLRDLQHRVEQQEADLREVRLFSFLSREYTSLPFFF